MQQAAAEAAARQNGNWPFYATANRRDHHHRSKRRRKRRGEELIVLLSHGRGARMPGELASVRLWMCKNACTHPLASSHCWHEERWMNQVRLTKIHHFILSFQFSVHCSSVRAKRRDAHHQAGCWCSSLRLKGMRTRMQLHGLANIGIHCLLRNVSCCIGSHVATAH